MNIACSNITKVGTVTDAGIPIWASQGRLLTIEVWLEGTRGFVHLDIDRSAAADLLVKLQKQLAGGPTKELQ